MDSQRMNIAPLGDLVHRLSELLVTTRTANMRVVMHDTDASRHHG
jgi:hypothetical protein